MGCDEQSTIYKAYKGWSEAAVYLPAKGPFMSYEILPFNNVFYLLSIFFPKAKEYHVVKQPEPQLCREKAEAGMFASRNKKIRTCAAAKPAFHFSFRPNQPSTASSKVYAHLTSQPTNTNTTSSSLPRLNSCTKHNVFLPRIHTISSTELLQINLLHRLQTSSNSPATSFPAANMEAYFTFSLCSFLNFKREMGICWSR